MAREFSKAFYNSKQWKECRASYIAKVHELCETCLEKGFVKPGYILHHKIELTPSNINDPNITLNHDNLKYECLMCHNKHLSKDNSIIREGLFFDENGDLVIDPPH